jgi:hypothetical protein
MRRRALAMAAVLGGGCGGGGSTNVSPTMRFSERSDAEISRIISAAGGTDMFGAEAQLSSFDDPFMMDPCPNIAVDGITVSIAGGCTTKDGAALSGDAQIVNPTGWTDVDTDFSRGSEYDLHAFTIARQGFTQSYDGFVKIEGFSTWDCDITATQLGIAMRSDLHYECSQGDQTCELSGSGIELYDSAGALVGGALVSGTVSLQGQSGHAEYSLRGADRLDATIDKSCVTWAIDGGTPHKTGACQ